MTSGRIQAEGERRFPSEGKGAEQEKEKKKWKKGGKKVDLVPEARETVIKEDKSIT